jgi:hypothetical protein
MENSYRKVRIRSSAHYTSIHFVWIAIIIRNESWSLYLTRLESKALH